MADWRHTGYVPDSDEEDDIPALSATATKQKQPAYYPRQSPPSRQRTHLQDGVEHSEAAFAGCSTDEQELGNDRLIAPLELERSALPSVVQDLGTLLESGLSQVREVLQNYDQVVPQAQSPRLSRRRSSSLSSLPSLTFILDGHDDTGTHGGSLDTDTERTDRQHSVEESSPSLNGVNDEATVNLLQTLPQPTRNLRQRNAAQIAPYSLEYAKYVQQCHRAGIRPQLNPYSKTDQPRKPIFEESQHAEADFSSSPAGFTNFQELDALEGSSEPSGPMTDSARVENPLEDVLITAYGSEEDEYDLPGLDQLIRGHNLKEIVLRKSHKKCHAKSQKAFPSKERSNKDWEITSLRPNSGVLAESTDDDVSADDRVLHLSSMKDTSSTQDSMPQAIFESAMISSSQPSQSSQSPPTSPAPVQNYQKRIRGVLPASWLRLDMDKQIGANKSNIAGMDSPEPVISVKGVARPVVRQPLHRQNQHVADKHVIVLEDSSSDRDEEQAYEDEELQRPTHIARQHTELLLDHIMEDDEIDTMAPSRPRSRGLERLSNQSKAHLIRRPLLPTTTNTRGPTTTGKRKRQHRVDKYLHKDWSRKRLQKTAVFRPLRSGILDALVASTSASNIPQPDFLQLAAKKAICRGDLGRRIPYTKFVQLQTTHDTAEAQASLQGWITGTISPAQGLSRPGIPLCPPEAGSGTNQTDRLIQQTLQRQMIQLKHKTNEARSIQGSNGLDSKQTSTRDSLYVNRNGLGRMVNGNPYRSGFRPGQSGMPTSVHQTIQTPSGPLQKPRIDYQDETHEMISSRHRVAHVPFDDDIVRQDMARIESDANMQPITDLTYRPRKLKPKKWQSLKMSQHACSLPAVSRNFQDIVQRPAMISDSQHKIISFLSIDHSGFDIWSLPQDFYYHKSTIIGSGCLSHVMQISKVCQPNCPDLPVVVSKDESSCRHLNWMCFADAVPHDYEQLLNAILETYNDAAAAVEYFEHSFDICASVVTVFSRFPTPKDEVSLRMQLRQMTKVLSRTFDGMLIHSQNGWRQSVINSLFVHAYQIKQFASVLNDVSEIKLEAHRVAMSFCRLALIGCRSREGLHQLQKFAANVRDTAYQEESSKEEWPFVDAVVIANNLLRHDSNTEDIWQVLSGDSLHFGAGPLPQICSSDKAVIVNLIAPLLEIDAHGLLQSQNEAATTTSTGAWAFIYPTIEDFLQTFDGIESSRIQMQRYGRRLIKWCVDLSLQWHWSIPDRLLRIWHRSFTDNDMRDLFGGSYDTTLMDKVLLNDDCPIYGADSAFLSYMCLLKRSIRHKRQTIPMKRLMAFVHGLFPNTGKVLHKDQELLFTDLASVRHRHDLYLVLYVNSSVSCRPRIDQIRDMVDLSSSHIDICRVNLKALERLLHFHLQREPEPAMTVFTDWLQRLMITMMRQRQHAEDEVLELFKGERLPKAAEDTITANKRTIEQFLQEVILVWQESTLKCQTLLQAQSLLSASILDLVLGIARACNGAADSLVISIINALHSIGTNGLDSIARQKIINSSCRQQILGSLKQILGSSFGSEATVSDHVLTGITLKWFELARSLVRAGLREWNDFFGEYGKDSWHSLLESKQTLKFGIMLASRIIEDDIAYYEDNRPLFLKMLFRSLVLPDDMLCYDHQLLAQILLRDMYNPLLFNVPVVLAEADKLSLTEFLERRLSIIFAMCRNIRKFCIDNLKSQDLIIGLTEQDYSEFLSVMLRTIRTCYNESDETKPARQQYIEFVHQVLLQMETYTRDICPLDGWFTDGTGFPAGTGMLRAKLNGLALSMSTSGATRTIASLLLNHVTKLVLKDRSEELVKELSSALLDLGLQSHSTSGSLDPDTALRAPLIRMIMPVYVERILDVSSHAFAVPMLQVAKKVFGQIQYRSSCWDAENVTDMMTAAFQICQSSYIAVSSLSGLGYLSFCELRGVFEIAELAHSMLFFANQTVLVFGSDQLCKLSEAIFTSLGDLCVAFKRIVLETRDSAENHGLSNFQSVERGPIREDIVPSQLGKEEQEVQDFARREVKTMLERHCGVVTTQQTPHGYNEVRIAAVHAIEKFLEEAQDTSSW